MDIRIFPPEEILETRVEGLPLSKSIAARVLILNALTPGADTVAKDNLPECDDIEVLKNAIAEGSGEINLHDSGTALRLLTAYFAVKEGAEVILAGSKRLCERPIAPLVEALRSLGGDIEYVNADNHAPLRIRGKHLAGGDVAVDAALSSQFVSSLALVAPTMTGGLRINMGGRIPSMPYVAMTLRMLEARGIDARTEAYTVVVPEGELKKVDTEAEPDWTAASYWYEITAITAGWVTLPGLRPDSLQGDSVLARIGERFGVITGFEDDNAELSASPDLYSRLDLDLSDYPDLVPALAVTAATVGMPFQFSGVANLRHKESDRIEALRYNLAKLGIIAETGPDGIGWEGERMPIVDMPEIEPHSDHRIAMAFAPVAAALPGIIIRDAEVVDKSYPKFFDDLRAAGFTITDASEPLPEAPHEE